MFTATLCVALAAAFPFQDLAGRLAKGGKADLLTVAYLRAWLRAEPDNAGLTLTLARQLQMIGSYKEAFASLKPLLEGPDPELRKSAQRQEIDILRSQAWSLPENNPQRAELLALAMTKLRILLPEPIAKPGSPQSEAFAALSTQEQKAALINAANAPPPDADFDWFTQQARALLGFSLYRLSADLSWRAMDLAPTPAFRRQAFDTALATLEAGNMSALALDQLEPHLKTLPPDATLYKRLVRLAMAAGRLDIAERYAKIMLKLSVLEQWKRFQAPNSPLEEALASASLLRISSQLGSNEEKALEKAAAELSGPGLPFDDETYRLGFDVFMARGNQLDALRVVRSAVKQSPSHPEWLRRLAQLTEWTGKPADSLDAWLTLAKQQGNAEHWGHVKRLAVMLLDFDKQLLAMQWEQSKTPSADNLFAIAKLLEHLGRPNDAVTLFIDELTQTPNNLPALERLLALLHDMQDGKRLELWLSKAMQTFPQRADYAVRLAQHLVERSEQTKAYYVLVSRMHAARAVQDQQKLKYKELYFWSLLADLARTLQHDEVAIDAMLIMLSHDRLSEAELANLIALADERAPELSVALAQYAFTKFSTPRFAQVAASMLMQQGNVQQLTEFIERLPASIREQLESDANFLSQRANLYLVAGRNEAARKDIEVALRRSPENAEIKAQAIWLLIGIRDSRGLRSVLHQWEALSRRQPSLWGPFGAAWMALQEPQRARPYFVRQSRLKPDFLWNLTLADCLEQTGLPDAAWGIRRQTWLELRKQRETGKSTLDMRHQTAVLAMQFAVGADTKRMLNSMIQLTPAGRRSRAPTPAAESNADKQATQISRLIDSLKNPTIEAPAAAQALRQVWEVSSQLGSALLADAKADVIDNSSIKELALSYFLSNEQTELAKAWLLSNYASALQRPSWAELNIALAQKDEATLVRLLDTVADWLPKFDRIEALQHTKQLATAQSLAYQLAEQRPDSVEANQRLTQLLDDQSSSARIFWASGNQSSVTYRGPRLETHFRLSPSLAIEAKASSSSLHNSDPNFPIALSTREIETELGLRWLRDSGRITTSLLNRSSLTDSTGLRVDWKENFDSKYHIQSSLQWRAPASETQGLRVYGYSNELKSSARYDISRREYVSGQVAFTQFGLEGQGAIARGVTMNAEAGHMVRIDYPDITARLTVARGRYKENSRFSSAASAFLSGNVATNRGVFLPGNSSSFNAQLGIGASAKDRNHGGGLTPFAQFALSYDSLVGTGYNASLGVSTSVVGNDRLFIGGNFISSTPANPRASREFSAGYRMQF